MSAGTGDPVILYADIVESGGRIRQGVLSTVLRIRDATLRAGTPCIVCPRAVDCEAYLVSCPALLLQNGVHISATANRLVWMYPR